jgi:hypothetical protein
VHNGGSLSRAGLKSWWLTEDGGDGLGDIAITGTLSSGVFSFLQGLGSSASVCSSPLSSSVSRCLL